MLKFHNKLKVFFIQGNFMNSKLLVIFSIVIFQASNGMQQPAATPGYYRMADYNTLLRRLTGNGFSYIANHTNLIYRLRSDHCSYAIISHEVYKALNAWAYANNNHRPVNEENLIKFVDQHQVNVLSILLQDYPEVLVKINTCVKEFDTREAFKELPHYLDF